jgi:tetratricopeptide (TPR) repeat protein
MSAGELFDLVWPVVSVLSALVATATLASARKRFPLYKALLIAIAIFFFPLIALPLYLAVLLFWKRQKIDPIKARFIVPLIFLAVILTSLAVLKYLEDRSVDAHLSRAALAKVNNNPKAAIRDYREALKLEENPHTRKLLAFVLAEAGNLSEAIAELRIARNGGEPDDAIEYHLGVLLERANKKDESIIEFKKFRASATCQKIDARCEDARQRIEIVEP